jgi:hypothetical protein
MRLSKSDRRGSASCSRNRTRAAHGHVESLELRRYLSGVSVDRTFGNNGVVFARPEDQWSFYSGRIAAMEDGRVYVADTESQGLLGRFLRDGKVDTTFGNQGFINVTDGVVGGNHFGIRQIIAKADGTLLVAATITTRPTPNTSRRDIGVFQFTPSGMPDTSFGVGGLTTITAPAARANDVGDFALLDDDRIVVAGVSETSISSRSVDRGIIARLNAEQTFLHIACPSPRSDGRSLPLSRSNR